jgi:putative transposase
MGVEGPMDWKQLLVHITGSVDAELRLRNEYLAAENRILRTQINGRVRLTQGDRRALAELGQKLGRKVLEEIATVATPNTMLAWPRKFVDQKCDGSPQRQAPGRPKVDPALEALVVRMAQENCSWGYDRIVGALTNLGYMISDQTVGNILKRHGIPPAPERKKTMTWREFIRIHMDMLGATDFFSSEIWTWCRFVIPTLLSFIRPHCRKIHVASLKSYLNAWWMLAWLPWSLDLHAFMGSWVGLVKEAMRSRRVLCGEGMLRQPLSASIFYDHQEPRRRGMGRVVCLSVVTPYSIRGSPMPWRQWPGEFLKYDNRAAA